MAKDKKLSGKLEEIIEMIINGDTYRKIADHFGVGLSTLHDFLSSDEHSARAKLALEISASSYDDKAEEALLTAPNDKNEIQRASQLAQHYRWKAGKRNPKKYGDKMDVTSAGERLGSPEIFEPGKPPAE